MWLRQTETNFTYFVPTEAAWALLRREEPGLYTSLVFIDQSEALIVLIDQSQSFNLTMGQSEAPILTVDQ